ncbi:MAG: hypothetical protein AAF438_15815, partial [Pseudomonadota bacterium]
MNDLFAIGLLKLAGLQIALGAILAISLWAFFFLRSKTNAVTRYRLWSIAFFSTALLPILTLIPKPQPSLPPPEPASSIAAPAAATLQQVQAPTTSNTIATPQAKNNLPVLARLFVLFW